MSCKAYMATKAYMANKAYTVNSHLMVCMVLDRNYYKIVYMPLYTVSDDTLADMGKGDVHGRRDML